MPKQPSAKDDWSAPKDWPAIKTEMRPLSWIKPYEANPRTHPPAQLDLLARSMREDGVTMPILVDEAGIVIAGHGRRLAALQNGYREYPVVIAKGWDENKKRAARIKDNAYGLLSGWDQELIRFEISTLQTMGCDMNLLGFGDAQLVQFTTTPVPPTQFQAVGDDLHVDKQCPRCGFVGAGDWSPKNKAAVSKRSRKK